MKRFILLLLAAQLTAWSAPAAIIVADWQFNTPGNTQGWTAQFGTTGLTVANAVDGGPESVLTAASFSIADVKINFPATALTLPAGATNWNTLTIRIRQIGTDGVTPVAFNNTGSFAMLSSPSGTLTWVNGTTGTAGAVPVTRVTEISQWNVFTFNIAAFGAAPIASAQRMDPFNATDIGGGNFRGNFEIDYVTLTAVPEPGQTVLLCGALATSVVLARRRRWIIG